MARKVLLVTSDRDGIMISGKSILITGGTGSFGKQFCEEVLTHYEPQRLIVYSRDEFKQAQMMADPRFKDTAMRFFLGDVRDKERLTRAMNGVDVVVHAAALKQVPAAEYNPHEFIKTNVQGAMNVVEAALNAGVSKVVALSTDKAVNPINLYGATKLCSDKIFIAANSYRGHRSTRFAVVRYGNVIGSRGSVIPIFLKQRHSGEVTITDPRMTRFFMTLKQGVGIVLQCANKMQGGELMIPKIPSCTIPEVAEIVAPGCTHKVVGIRPGEKLHEVLIPQDEAHLTLEFDDHFIIKPTLPNWEVDFDNLGGKSCGEDFFYASNNNSQKLTEEELARVMRDIANDIEKEAVC